MSGSPADPADFPVPTGREEEWGLKFIPLQPIVRGNNNADTWFGIAALTIDLGNNSIPRPGAPHRVVVLPLGAGLPGSPGQAAAGNATIPGNEEDLTRAGPNGRMLAAIPSGMCVAPP